VGCTTCKQWEDEDEKEDEEDKRVGDPEGEAEMTWMGIDFVVF
jgi:hypothetical protein